jgi:hypothetical protein
MYHYINFIYFGILYIGKLDLKACGVHFKGRSYLGIWGPETTEIIWGIYPFWGQIFENKVSNLQHGSTH